MSKKRSYKMKELEPEEEPKFEPKVTSKVSDYIAVRRISYELVAPAIKVAVGDAVPQQIINDKVTFDNLLSKKAIRKGG